MVSLKNIKLKQAIYPVTLVVYCIIAILLFIYATNFLAKNINDAFVIDESLVASREAKLDMTGLEAVGKKLGFVVGGQEVVPVPAMPVVPDATVATTTIMSTTTAVTATTTKATTTKPAVKQIKKK